MQRVAGRLWVLSASAARRRRAGDVPSSARVLSRYIRIEQGIEVSFTQIIETGEVDGAPKGPCLVECFAYGGGVWLCVVQKLLLYMVRSHDARSGLGLGVYFVFLSQSQYTLSRTFHTENASLIAQ